MLPVNYVLFFTCIYDYYYTVSLIGVTFFLQDYSNIIICIKFTCPSNYMYMYMYVKEYNQYINNICLCFQQKQLIFSQQALLFIDWLIEWCLTSTGKYFMHIQGESILINDDIWMNPALK